MNREDWLSRPRPERVVAVVCDLSAQTWKRHDFQPPREMNDVRAAAGAMDWGVIEEASRICRTLSPQEGETPGDEDKKTYLKSWASSFVVTIIQNPEEYGLTHPVSKGAVLVALEKAAPSLHRLIPASKRGLTEWWRMVDVALPQGRGNRESRSVGKLLGD